MSFRTRLFLTYFILIVLLVVLLGLGFYQYTANAFEENAYSNLSVISDKMSQQLDNLIHPIDLMITYLLSTENFMSSMTTLATLDKNNANNKVFITEARATVYSNIMNYATLKNFYRVSFFNREGDFSTSNFRVKDINMGFLWTFNSWKRDTFPWRFSTSLPVVQASKQE